MYKEDTTKCDSYEQEEKEYNVKEEKVSKEYKVNPNPVPSGVDLSSLEFVKITSKTEFKWKDIIEKKGMEYTDTLTWTDRLTYDNSASSYQKGYTVEQLKSALGSDVTLTEQETNYYSALEKNEELNLIDILNAKESIYSTYTNNPHSKNTGFARSYLVTSYDVLKQNLSNLYADYGQSIYYGQSLVPDIVALRSNFYDYSTLAAGAFGWPVPGNKTVGHLFGYTAAYNGKNNKHGGIDLWPDKSLPKWNTEIVAAKAGKVTLALDRHMSNTVRVKGSHGNYIEITHDDGTKTLYGHLTTGTFRVKKGDTVEAGQVIGIMGSSGDSSGEHLHFEIWVNGEKVDPLIFYNVEAINGNSIYEIYDDARKYAEPRYSTPAGTYKYVSSKGTTEDEQDTSGTTSGGTNTPPRPAGSNVTVEVN